jgi:hypothetical protein
VKLTTEQVDALPSRDRPYRVSDGLGLYLEIHPNGRRYWRQGYRFQGKQKLLAHGVFPRVSLEQARARTLAARAVLATGQDPAQLRRKQRWQTTPEPTVRAATVIPPLPTPALQSLFLDLPADLMQRLQAQAEARGLDCEALIRQWLEERLQQEDGTAHPSAS